jgi:hypothetical protein
MGTFQSEEDAEPASFPKVSRAWPNRQIVPAARCAEEMNEEISSSNLADRQYYGTRSAGVYKWNGFRAARQFLKLGRIRIHAPEPERGLVRVLACRRVGLVEERLTPASKRETALSPPERYPACGECREVRPRVRDPGQTNWRRVVAESDRAVVFCVEFSGSRSSVLPEAG